MNNQNDGKFSREEKMLEKNSSNIERVEFIPKSTTSPGTNQEQTLDVEASVKNPKTPRREQWNNKIEYKFRFKRISNLTDTNFYFIGLDICYQ